MQFLFLWLWGFKSAGKELEFRFEKATNFGTIGPRSGRDRATIVVLVARRSASDHLEVIPPLKLPDRGSITPRSRLAWSSSRTPPRRPIDHQATGGSRSRDRDPLSSSVRWRSNRSDETRRHLSKENKLIS